MTAALPGLLRRLHAVSPTWRVDVRELPTSEQLRRLLDRTLDVGFFLAEARVPDAVHTVAVARERACVGVPADHPLARREGLSLGELAGERLILFPRTWNPALYDEIVARVSGDGARAVDVVPASSRQVAAGLVAAGLGVSTFTEGMRQLCGPDVVLVPQVDPERTTSVLMGWHRELRNPLADLLDRVAPGGHGSVATGGGPSGEEPLPAGQGGPAQAVVARDHEPSAIVSNGTGRENR